MHDYIKEINNIQEAIKGSIYLNWLSLFTYLVHKLIPSISYISIIPHNILTFLIIYWLHTQVTSPHTWIGLPSIEYSAARYGIIYTIVCLSFILKLPTTVNCYFFSPGMAGHKGSAGYGRLQILGLDSGRWWKLISTMERAGPSLQESMPQFLLTAPDSTMWSPLSLWQAPERKQSICIHTVSRRISIHILQICKADPCT